MADIGVYIWTLFLALLKSLHIGSMSLWLNRNIDRRSYTSNLPQNDIGIVEAYILYASPRNSLA